MTPVEVSEKATFTNGATPLVGKALKLAAGGGLPTTKVMFVALALKPLNFTPEALPFHQCALGAEASLNRLPYPELGLLE